MLFSGSKLGKIKGAAMIELNSKILNEENDVIDLPDLNFGRYHHAMTVLEQRYLYVFGGKFVQSLNYHLNLFERLDLKYPKRGWDLIHFQWDNPDLDPLQTPLYTNVNMTPLNSREILIFGKSDHAQFPTTLVFNTHTNKSRELDLGFRNQPES